MSNWFKLICAYEDNEDWIIQELKEGRLRFGWSPPGSNLRELHKKEWDELDAIEIGNDDWSDTGSYIYKQSKFLLFRIKKGDKIVVQLSQPLRDFCVCEVTGEYEYPDIEGRDFNHILPCRLITDNPIPLNSQYITNSLRHALSKRGKYYGIYPQDAIEELNNIVTERTWLKEDFNNESTHEIEMNKTKEALIMDTIQLVQKKWAAKYFEYLMVDIFKSIKTIDIKEDWDSGKGWDILLTMRDPVTDEILYDNIPVQCKNYSGNVDTEKPLDDIKRCFENLEDISIAYIAIIGDLTDDFRKKHREVEKQLYSKLEREIAIRIIDQEQIARLYLKMQSSIL